MSQHFSTHLSSAGATLLESGKRSRFKTNSGSTTDFSLDQILIVDDDQFTRHVLNLFLLRDGVETIWNAKNGEDALEILAANSGIGCIFLDIYMPIKDGMELVQLPQLRVPELAVFLMSSKTDHTLSHAQKLAEAYGVNVIGALNKPFTPEQLSSLFDRS